MEGKGKGSSSGRSPREHIEDIRNKWFGIGAQEANKLAPMLDKAVQYLSAELYTKDVHFLMELIQNAEDNDYLEGVDPSLEFIITSRDITSTGAPATLVMFNNEKGFSAKNIESICSVGNSTKVGHRKRGYIGEKGIGFKSVFLITAQPYLFSNGYQIRFNEKPCAQCQLGYIVPEWIEDSPTLSDIQKLYGSTSGLPTTVLVLPLKPDKVKPVKQQLSSLHPEVLLFLSKIKRLSVREDSQNPNHDTVSAIAVTKETNFAAKKNIDAESYTLHLCAEEKGETPERACSYYMWKQRFPVRQENRFERRMEVEEWVITLAFPNGERLHRGGSSPGVYAYLPTEMVTNFPFIIQADFVLASSRETILLDNKWNQGILDCVPLAFVNALVSLVKTVEDAPLSCLPRMFNFLPVKGSPYELLNVVRTKIKENLSKENIIPIESNTEQTFFQRPGEVRRLMPEFRNILSKAQRQGVSIHNLSSHGWYVLDSSFDQPEYSPVLEFLGVQQLENVWYAKCIVSSNMVPRVPEEVYLELLLYVAKKWRTNFCSTQMQEIPLIKYVSGQNSVYFCSITECSNSLTICQSSHSDQISWLIEWNNAFRFPGNLFFLPKNLQEAILSLREKDVFVEWLGNVVEVNAFTVNSYAERVSSLTKDRNLVVAYAHFLYQSLCNSFLSAGQVGILCKKMPLIDKNGCVTTAKKDGVVLVPASGSNWSQLIASNLWRSDWYVELGEDYSCSIHFANRSTTGKELIEFLKTHVKAADVPGIYPPDADISSMSAPLKKQNVFLLLRWIRNLRLHNIQIPSKFLNSIREGSWLRSTLNGFPGYRPPSQSFFLTNNEKSNWGNLLQNGSVLVDIPLVDQSFYGSDITTYKEDLKAVGVMFEFGEACTYIGNHLMSLAASSSLSRTQVFSMLNFIRLLRQKYLSPNDFIVSVKQHRWLVTCAGVRSPEGSVLYDEKWEVAREISDIPFIDGDHYGEDMSSFKEELKLLGVVVGFDENYQMVASHLKESFCSSSLTSKAFVLILNCIRHCGLSNKLAAALRNAKCLKTSIGYKSPSECYLSDPEWGGLLQIFSIFPLVDDNFYTEINAFKMELKQLGVKVDFEDAVKAFSIMLKKQASSSSVDKDNVFNLLSCYKKLKENAKSKELASCLKKSITDVCWLRTRLVDYRSPRDCIMFGPEWESISFISVLPFVDDSDNCYGKGIHDYRQLLKSIGVITDLKDGVKLVLAGLRFPSDASCILPTNVLSLLQCIRIMLEKKDDSFNGAFVQNATRAWLKTNVGYRCAGKCTLFDPKWKHVKLTDGPFIDEDFYGASLVSYKQELKAIGVVIDDLSKTCMLLADSLDSQSDFASIVRIYNFLKDSEWKPRKDSRRIYLPSGDNCGIWVNADECVLHDKNGLFGLQLHVLDKHYKDSLLSFFGIGFEVKSNPSFEDHCLLWKQWENEGCDISQAQCCAFWQCVLQHWGPRTQKTLSADLVKLPVSSKSGEILLLGKSDVFLGDDLLLNDMFERESPDPLFIWYPEPTVPSLPRTKLLEIYKNIGVRGISKSVTGQEVSLTDSNVEHKELNPRESLFRRGLMKVILGFLAGPSVNMDVHERHEAVRCLLNLTVLETVEPITIDYTIVLSSRESVNVQASEIVRWHKETSKFFTQKLDMSGACGWKNRLEYATKFAQAVAGGLLWEKEDEISELAELIKFVFLLEFDEEAVEYLMKSKNLQIFRNDEEFLSVAYPSAGQA